MNEEVRKNIRDIEKERRNESKRTMNSSSNTINTLSNKSRDTITQVTSFINKNKKKLSKAKHQESECSISDEHNNSTEFDSIFIFENTLQNLNDKHKVPLRSFLIFKIN